MEHVNAEILRAIADGKKVQHRDAVTGTWKDFDVKSVEACMNLLAPGEMVWRIAPKTIKIGDCEVPAPCREAPRAGEAVWVVNPITKVASFYWNCTEACYLVLNDGFVHLSEEAARQHYEAIKNLLQEK